MSIEASYRRITPSKFARLQNDPQAAASYFGTNFDDMEDLEASEEDRYLNIGTDWHALHFLLTGDGELKPHPLPPPPLGNVVQGGTATGWDCTYGKIRSLTPEEVRAVADALNKISEEDLRSRFSVASFNAAQIYPHGKRGQWTEEDAGPVFEIYACLVEFFTAAAQAGDMVLLSSD